MLNALLLAAAIMLDGVTGDQLTARAYFDANNVLVGDPMLLTIDFIGAADFAALHPPALSRELDRKVWKIDDRSAKTDTYLNARRLVYRIRPMREGVLEFPALDFAYLGRNAETVTVSTAAIPVRAKAGSQAALASLDQPETGLPMPDGISCAAPEGLSEDELFAWRRACAHPSAEGFAAFAFPSARLNEAACHLLDGNWAKAMKIYTRLEWVTGQTAAIERGLVAALARKTGDGNAELPVWRVAGRPLLRCSWKGRLGWVLGVFASLWLLVWLAGKAVGRLACVALVCLCASSALAEDPFERMERMIQEQRQRMDQLMNGLGGLGGFSVGGGVQPQPVEVKAVVAPSKRDLRVGERFEFILSLEVPRNCSIDQVRLTPSEMFGMVVEGKVQNLPDGRSTNPSNVIKRSSFPIRYDVPFKGTMTFAVEGLSTVLQEIGRGRNRSSYRFTQNFQTRTPPLKIEIKPLPTDGQPADFSGVIATTLKITTQTDRKQVATNDIVKVFNIIEYSGFAPQGAFPNEVERRPGRVTTCEYFVADGSTPVPRMRCPWYNSRTRRYEVAQSEPLRLIYRPEETVANETIAVDGNGAGKHQEKVLKLRFAPAESAVEIGVSSGAWRVTEENGIWARIDDGRHAGWVKKEMLK